MKNELYSEDDLVLISISRRTLNKLNDRRRCGEDIEDVINRVMVVGGEIYYGGECSNET
jgi:hypothetical protein